MNRLSTLIIFFSILALTACSKKDDTNTTKVQVQEQPKEQGISIVETNGKYRLYIDGAPVFIKGVGGMNRLDIAVANGANAFRTWGGNVERVKAILDTAAYYNMYVMQGIDLTKDSASYFDEEYKENARQRVRNLAETFKDNPNLLIWGLGNEIDLANANIPEAWMFVNELAELIKSIDDRHLVASVISHSKQALALIAEHAPALDLLGINSYGPIGEVESMVSRSPYKGAYLITEWGPTGFWETSLTTWGAPLEQTSEEKKVIYEARYNSFISGSDACLGSFVFLWGQKEERTPTWFSMFVEKDIEGLPLNGEKTPQVEAMQRVWTGEEPEQTAPVITDFTIGDLRGVDSIIGTANMKFTATVQAHDKEEDELQYVWEVLEEATVLGFGGSYEPRPERVGKVKTGSNPQESFSFKAPGNYRIYVYVLDGKGFAATANIPIQIQ